MLYGWVDHKIGLYLNLWLGVDPDSALVQSEKGLNHVRQTLNDQWNTHGDICK